MNNWAKIMYNDTDFPSDEIEVIGVKLSIDVWESNLFPFHCDMDDNGSIKTYSIYIYISMHGHFQYVVRYSRQQDRN